MIIIDDDGIMHKVVPMSVIEDIKAEIEHARNQFIAASGMYQALNMALNIIDKHMKEGE